MSGTDTTDSKPRTAARTKTPEQPPAHPQHPSLAHALAAFQAELPRVAKVNEAKVRSDKGNYVYSYADLTDVTEVAMPLLGKHGLSFIATPTLRDGQFVLAYTLQHESGQDVGGVYPIAAALGNPQQVGSAITYARRYALCAVTGIAPGGDDDDAQAATEAAAQEAHQQRVNEQRDRTQQRTQASRPAAAQRPQQRPANPALTLTDDEWIARAAQAPTLDGTVQVWREARQDASRPGSTVTAELIDKLSIICQERKQATEPPAADNDAAKGDS